MPVSLCSVYKYSRTKPNYSVIAGSRCHYDMPKIDMTLQFFSIALKHFSKV